MLLDSTFLHDLIRGDESAEAIISTFDTSPRRPVLGISPLTIYEVGIGLRGDAATHRPRFERAVGRLETAPLDGDVAHKALDIQHTLMDQGERIGAVDVLIAATAATREDNQLLTRHVDEFERVPEIDVTTY